MSASDHHDHHPSYRTQSRPSTSTSPLLSTSVPAYTATSSTAADNRSVHPAGPLRVDPASSYASSRPTSPNPLPPEAQINDGVGNLNRWSQSTASSAGALESPRRSRASSGAAASSIWNRRKLSASQPESPYKEDLSYSRTRSKQPESAQMDYPDNQRRNTPSLSTLR